MNFVICVNNEGYEDSLYRWKVYRAIPDTGDQTVGLLRVIDETGEDYLFPSGYFRTIEIPLAVLDALEAKAVA